MVPTQKHELYEQDCSLNSGSIVVVQSHWNCFHIFLFVSEHGFFFKMELRTASCQQALCYCWWYTGVIGVWAQSRGQGRTVCNCAYLGQRQSLIWLPTTNSVTFQSPCCYLLKCAACLFLHGCPRAIKLPPSTSPLCLSPLGPGAALWLPVWATDVWACTEQQMIHWCSELYNVLNHPFTQQGGIITVHCL